LLQNYIIDTIFDTTMTNIIYKNMYIHNKNKYQNLSSLSLSQSDKSSPCNHGSQDSQDSQDGGVLKESPGNDQFEKIAQMDQKDIESMDRETLVSIVRSNGYPYKKYTISHSDVLQMMDNLTEYIPPIINQNYTIKNISFNPTLTFLGKPTIIVQLDEDYSKYNNLSDYFQEECRMKCKRYDQSISPYNYFYDNIEKTIDFALKRYNKINNYTLRESLYSMIPECTAFRPTLMVSMIKLFGGRTILDFSSGWGDRLLGALACDKIIDFYCGVDPNSCLHPNYQHMISFFKRDPNKFMMIQSEFQTATVPIKNYNLIFTSPPYFVLEKYSDEPTQSINKNTELDDWLENFLFFSLKKSWDLLIDQGHLAISINDMRDSFKFVEQMMRYMDQLETSEYLGVISYAAIKNSHIVSPQPIWIWKKNNPLQKINIDDSDTTTATSRLSRSKTKKSKRDGSLSRSENISMQNLTDDEIERLLNPMIKIIPETVRLDDDKEVKLFIVRDDYLIGGTKQRIMKKVIEGSQCKEFIYAGPVYGYAQIALAYAGKLLNRRITLFVETITPMHRLTLEAKNYGAKIMQMGKRAKLKYVQEKAVQYYEKNKSNSVCLIPFGLHTPLYIDYLAQQIKLSLPIDLTDEKNHPKRMWLVAGSATLLNALYKVFPGTFFNVVQVGKTIWEDMTEPQRTKIYISDERFQDKATIQPPYPTVSTYDAKLWKYVLQDAMDGDYVWNVGKDL
jgi:1-aminocyclopropane-1-carboxylate deaminase/D-cysteine desulfhydrase-like pyridoxal-dependent ACC family enzyme